MRKLKQLISILLVIQMLLLSCIVSLPAYAEAPEEDYYAETENDYFEEEEWSAPEEAWEPEIEEYTEEETWEPVEQEPVWEETPYVPEETADPVEEAAGEMTEDEYAGYDTQDEEIATPAAEAEIPEEVPETEAQEETTPEAAVVEAPVEETTEAPAPEEPATQATTVQETTQEQTSEEQTTEEQTQAETEPELRWQVLTVTPEKEIIDDIYHPSALWQWVGRCWDRLFHRQIKAEEKPAETKVEISGMLPEGVYATVKVIELSEEGTHKDMGLYAYVVKLFDAYGKDYVPADDNKVIITVRSDKITKAQKEKKTVWAYTYIDNVYEGQWEYNAATEWDNIWFETKTMPLYLFVTTYDEAFVEEETTAAEATAAEEETTIAEATTADEETTTVEEETTEISPEAPAPIEDLTLYAGDNIYLTGSMPAEGIVEATPVDVQIEGQVVLAAYDIVIYEDEQQKAEGIPWQPEENTVQVHIVDPELSRINNEELTVYGLEDVSSEAQLSETAQIEENEVVVDAGKSSIVVIAQQLLEKEITIDGVSYKVTVAYDTTAGIPDGAELSVTDVPEDSEAYYLEQAADILGWQEQDSIFYAKVLDIRILYEGEEIQPLTPVTVSVELQDIEETDVTASEAIQALEVVHFHEEEERTEVLAPESTAFAKDAACDVSFETDGFSTFVIAGVFRSLQSWTTDVADVCIQSLDKTLTLNMEATAADGTVLVKGQELLEAYTINDPEGLQPGTGSVRANVTLDEGLALEELEHIEVYSIRDGALQEMISDTLEPGAQTSVSLNETEGFALVKDTGLREMTLVSEPEIGQSIVLEGMMPMEAELQAAAVEELPEVQEAAEWPADNLAEETAEEPTEDLAEVAEDIALEQEDAVSEDADASEAAAEEPQEPEDSVDTVLCAYDISIIYHGDKFQPKDGETIKVAITNDAIAEALEQGRELSLWHYADDGSREEITEFAVEGSTVTFDAAGFSVYTVETAKEPFVPGTVTRVQTREELAANYNNPETGGKGFFLSYLENGTTEKYCTTAINGKNAFVEDSNTSAAGKWYFESAGNNNTYYVYTYISGEKQYMHNSGINMSLGANPGTSFVLSNVPSESGKLYFNVVGTNNYFQHSNSGGGMRLYDGHGNATNNNSKILISYAKDVSIPDDYYGLNGKSFGIAYHEESVKGAALTATGKTVSNQARLEAEELLVRPDVLNTTGELLIAEGIDLVEWTFTFVEGSTYYLSTQIGGATKYLSLNGRNLTLSDVPAAITVESGTGENAGKYMLKTGDYALTLSGGKAANGFASSNSGGANSWLSLISKSELLKDDDFQVYSAEKVDLSDNEQVPNGSEVVLYTRIWNDTTKKYEFYVVNYDGSLFRAFESGDVIQWIGSTINTAEWGFTEYYNDPDAETLVPSYFYQLQNTYSDECIRPQNNGEFLRDEIDYPNYLDRSINLNGRRYGYYYSTILAWDDDSYAYMGLRVKEDRSGVEACSLSEADTFYFAKMKPIEESPDPTTVKTIDHETYGITVKMVNLENGGNDHNGYMSQFLGNNDYTQTAAKQGLLSTDIGADGYPTVTKNGKHLGELYSGAAPVNHLFIENTYYSSGYYEFDSTQTFASFYNIDTDSWDYSNFTVYEELGTNDLKNSDTMKHGQFLPYNMLSHNYAVVNPLNLYDANADELPDSDPRKGEKLLLVNNPTDYYYAMEISATFTQTPNGHDAWGHDIIYEFTGDDDFWLYVDGELIIDLGGIHGALPGSVNYCTGEVTVNGVTKTLRQIFTENFTQRYQAEHGSTPSQAELDAYLNQYFDPGETIFKEYTDHTMRIFYMERGAGAANLHMRFNLASVKPGTVLLSKEIAGVDSTESYMAEYPFQIFYKESDAEDADEHQLTVADDASVGIRVVYKDTNRLVTLKPSYTAPDGQVYEYVFMLQPGEIAEIDFPDHAMRYYIKECAVDITTVDNTVNPAATTHQGVYTRVMVNGEEITGVPNEQGKGRQDFSIPYDYVNGRGRVTFQNWVDPNAKGTLSFEKHLYAEDGQTPIPHEQSDTTFTFRLYLGTENTPDDALPLANMYRYHVRDGAGNYCIWNGSKLVPIQGKTVYDDGNDEVQSSNELTPAERDQATFTTSMNGTISNIPVDYKVEVREIPAGTKYKVEERDYEIPDGYTLQWYVTTIETELGQPQKRFDKNPATGIINLISEYNDIEIRNLKGWGLRVYKEWSDADWMAERDAVYFAVYTEDNGTLTFVDNEDHNMVHRITRNEESAYWFFQTIEDLDGNGVKNADDFEKYVIREVLISSQNPTVDSNGRVSNYGIVTPIAVDGSGQIILNGKQYGDADSSDFTYSIVSYETGTLPEGANVRHDTITNKRAGIDLYKIKADGDPLPGAVFELLDGSGNYAGNGTFTSDENGLITIAYLREDEIYTLTEISSPIGYQGMQISLKLKREGNTVFVSDDEGITWVSSVEDSSDGWYTVDDTDKTSGTDIRIGKVTIKNKPYTLKIKKTQKTAAGAALEGVHFALYRQVLGNNGQPRKDYQPITGYDDLVTDSDGMIPELTNAFQDGSLRPGTYYLYEKSPLTGYRPLGGDVIFTVGDNGAVELDEASPSGVELQHDGEVYTIVVPNELADTTTLTVAKTVVNGTTSDTDGTNKFNYMVRLYLPDGITQWKVTDENFTNGVASFALGHGDSIPLAIPLGAVVTVNETANSTYTTDAAMTVTTSGADTTSTCEFNSSNLTSTVHINDLIGVTLTYTNTRKTVTVTVKKEVVGDGGTFSFTAKLTDELQKKVAGYTIYTDSSDSIITNQNGEAVFTLSPGNNKTVQKVLTIPYGTNINVTEEEAAGYTTTIDGVETRVYTGTLLTANKTVTFTNTSGANLSVVKTVTGDFGDPAKQFTFTVDGLESGKSYTYKKYNTTDGSTWTEIPNGGGTLTTDAKEFTLSHHQKIVIEKLPLNRQITLTEQNEIYTTTWKKDGTDITPTAGSGTSAVTLTLTGDSTLDVTNNLNAAAPTGVRTKTTPFGLMALGGVLILGIFLVPMALRRRRGR